MKAFKYITRLDVFYYQMTALYTAGGCLLSAAGAYMSVLYIYEGYLFGYGPMPPMPTQFFNWHFFSIGCALSALVGMAYLYYHARYEANVREVGEEYMAETEAKRKQEEEARNPQPQPLLPPTDNSIVDI